MTSAQEQLQNLQKIGKLKDEPPDQAEFDGLVRSAKRKLPDAENPALSPDSRFILAYDAAHSLALAALRWRGFRAGRAKSIDGVARAGPGLLQSCHELGFLVTGHK